MRKANWFLAVMLIAAAGALSYSITHADERVTLEDLPPAVRAAIQQHAAGGQIVEVEKELEGGQVVYEAEVIQNGREVDILVSEAGEFLGREEDDDDDSDGHGDDDDDDDGEERVTFRDLPAAVKATLNLSYRGIRFDGFSKEVEDGHEVYEAVYVDGERKHELKLTQDGHVLEAEEEVTYASLPLAVQEAIHARYAGATVDEAEAVRVTFYEVELKTADGEEVEVKVLADGRMLGVEDAR